MFDFHDCHICIAVTTRHWKKHLNSLKGHNAFHLHIKKNHFWPSLFLFLNTIYYLTFIIRITASPLPLGKKADNCYTHDILVWLLWMSQLNKGNSWNTGKLYRKKCLLHLKLFSDCPSCFNCMTITWQDCLHVTRGQWTETSRIMQQS